MKEKNTINYQMLLSTLLETDYTWLIIYSMDLKIYTQLLYLISLLLIKLYY